MYTDPRHWTIPQDSVPNGQFILPVCTSRDGLQKMMEALYYARGLFSKDGSDLSYMSDMLEALAFLQDPGNCECLPLSGTPEDGNCTSYSNRQALITFAPNDPRVDPYFVPRGYTFPPFYIPPFSTDIVTTLERIPIEFLQAIGSAPDGLPRIRVKFTGSGVVELHMVAVPLGGIALVFVDDNPLSVSTIALEKDFISLPPTLVDEVVAEIEVSGAGEHHIDITFIPVLDDEATVPLKFGGGLRRVVLCGQDIQADTTMINFTLSQQGCQLLLKVGDETPHVVFDSSTCGATEATPILYRRKPGQSPDNYLLQVSVDGGSHWIDTGYDLSGMVRYRANFYQVRDQNFQAVGDWQIDDSQVNPDGTYQENWLLTLDGSKFKGDPGEDGQTPNITLTLLLDDWYQLARAGVLEYPPATPPDKNFTLRLPDGFYVDQTQVKLTQLAPGATPYVTLEATDNPDIDPRYKVFHFHLPAPEQGDPGQAITVSIGNILITDPNIDPDVTIYPDSGDPNHYLLGFSFPRSRHINIGSVTTVASTDPATVTASEDEHGDTQMDFEIPRGADGLPGQDGQDGLPGQDGRAGQDGITIDETPPDAGVTKHYRFLVPASGFIIPFPIYAGWTISNVVPSGQWYNVRANFPESKKANGGDSGTFPSAGSLLLMPSDSAGLDPDGYQIFPDEDWFNPLSGDFTADHDCRVIFRQDAGVLFDIEVGGLTGTIGEGWIMLDCDITAGNPPVYPKAYHQSGAATVTQLAANKWRFLWEYPNGTNVADARIVELYSDSGYTVPVNRNIVDINVLQHQTDDEHPCGVGSITEYHCESWAATPNGSGVGTRSPGYPDSFFYHNAHRLIFWSEGNLEIEITVS